MLSVKALCGHDGSYYVKDGYDHRHAGKEHPAEYFLGGVRSGPWVGSGAERLGLCGVVDREA